MSEEEIGQYGKVISNKDGGNVFPAGFYSDDRSIHPFSGMSMRQYYKAVALQGLLAGSLSTDELYGPGSGDSDIKLSKQMIAECAGELAEEMLKEDEQHEQSKTK